MRTEKKKMSLLQFLKTRNPEGLPNVDLMGLEASLDDLITPRVGKNVFKNAAELMNYVFFWENKRHIDCSFPKDKDVRIFFNEEEKIVLVSCLVCGVGYARPLKDEEDTEQYYPMTVEGIKSFYGL